MSSARVDRCGSTSAPRTGTSTRSSDGNDSGKGRRWPDRAMSLFCPSRR
jgi:hypothetical protein